MKKMRCRVVHVMWPVNISVENRNFVKNYEKKIEIVQKYICGSFN